MHEGLPPTPHSSTPSDADFRLDLPFFEIPDDVVLRMLMEREKAAANIVHDRVKSFLEPGMSLVGADGKTPKDVAQRLNDKITSWMLELVKLPTVASEWAASPNLTAKEGGLSTTSWAIAYMIYQEFARVLMQRNLKGFVNSMDFALISGMNAIHHGWPPLAAYKKAFSIKAEDKEGKPVLGDHSAELDAELRALQSALYAFLEVKGLTTTKEVRLLDENSSPVLSLTIDGVHLLEHLMSVMGCTESMRQQGPEIVRALLAKDKPEETRTEGQIQSDLKKSATEPKEA